jgi:hypothetical protein
MMVVLPQEWGQLVAVWQRRQVAEAWWRRHGGYLQIALDVKFLFFLFSYYSAFFVSFSSWYFIVIDHFS